MNASILLCSIGIIISMGWNIVTAHAVIKVGIAAPLTGSTFNLGEQQEVGALKAVKHLNEKGGILGEKIITISVDDACEPTQAETVARQLVNEGVVFVVGHGCSHCSIAASKIYEEAGVIMISPSSTNPKVTDEGGPNVFRVSGRDDQQGTIAGNFLADHHGKSNIAIIHDGQSYGLSLAKITKYHLNKRGINEVLFESYTPDRDDYNLIVNKLARKEVNILYAGGYLQDIGIIVRQAKKKLPNLRLYSGDSLVNVDFLFIAGDAGIGTYFTFGPDMRLNIEAKDVVTAIRDEDAFEPDGYTLYAYGAVQAWAQSVDQAGSFDANAVIGALRTGSFNTVLGRIGFNNKGDVTGIDTFVWYVFVEDDFLPVK